MFKKLFRNETVRLFFFIFAFMLPVTFVLLLYNPKFETQQPEKRQENDTARKMKSSAKAQREKMIVADDNRYNPTDPSEDIIVKDDKDTRPDAYKRKETEQEDGIHIPGSTGMDQPEQLTDAEKKALDEHIKKRSELENRLLDSSKKERLLAQALMDIADGEIELMLSIFNTMTPEQRKSARAEALKIFPRGDVESLFNDLDNTPKKNSDQIKSDARKLLSSLEAYRIAQRELDVEHNQLLTEMSEFYNYDFFNIPNDQ